MTPRKLSDVDKQQILELYRQPGETTTTLASRYGVSNSTISRILKSALPEDDYEKLIQEKRGARALGEGASSEADSSVASEVLEPPVELEVVVPEQLEMPLLRGEAETSSGRRSRRRSSAPATVDAEIAADSSSSIMDIAPVATFASSTTEADGETGIKEAKTQADPYAGAIDTLAVDILAVDTLEDVLTGDLLDDSGTVLDDLDEDDLQDELEDDLGEDDLDDDDLDDDDLDDDDLDGGLLLVSKIKGKSQVQVLPLAEASIPRTCYLVVDRSAELITRPLKEFGDLGQIPEAEVLAKTLPVFDNHRVAKRYSNPRTQRVIKLPDGRVLQKASSHLQAKGITRLLIDGQVYSLES